MQKNTNTSTIEQFSISESEAAKFFQAIKELDYNKVSWYCNEQPATSKKEPSNGTNFAKLKDSQTGQTALHMICNMVDDGSIGPDVVQIKLQIIKLLLVWGIDVMCQEKNGHTPIELAIKSNQLELVQFLSNMDELWKDYNIKITEAYLELALNYAEKQNNLRCYTHLKSVWMCYLQKEKKKNEEYKILSDGKISKREKELKEIDFSNIRNLTLQGGGVLGIAYVGALEVMEANGIKIEQLERIAGTSAGAISACLLAVGYTVKEIYESLEEFNFTNLLENGDSRDEFMKFLQDIKTKDTVDLLYRFIKLMLKDFHHLLGIFAGNKFKQILEEYIARKTGNGRITFAELHELRLRKGTKYFKDLYVVAQDICTSSTTVFSYESMPDASLSDCIRMSMSVPVVFQPVLHKAPGYDPNEPHLFVDGGISCNFPLTIFDKVKYLDPTSKNGEEYMYNPQTIGFRLLEKRYIKHYLDEAPVEPSPMPKSLFQFLRALYKSQSACTQELLYVMADPHHERTVFIDRLDISFLDFGLKREEVLNLLQSGRTGMKAYIERVKRKKMEAAEEATSSMEKSDWIIVDPKNNHTKPDNSRSCLLM